MLITRKIVTWGGLRLNGVTAAMKNIKRHRDKFKVDYEFMKNIPLRERVQELEKIKSLKKSKTEFNRQIPDFPENEQWDYHGVKLMTHTWQPPAHIKRKAVLIFHHSLNGHIGTFGQFARGLINNGYTVTGFDFINFGQSQCPRRGCVQSYDDLVETSEQYIIKMKNKYSGSKIFTAGLSLGGAVTFDVLLKHPKLVDGAIFLSPSIRENKLHYPFLKKLTLLLSMVLPYQPMVRQTAKNGSKYTLKNYSVKDPHIYHGRFYPKSVQELLLAMGRLRKQYSNFTTPYLCIQSGRDKLVDPFACLDLEQLSPCTDKTTVVIYDMWHAMWLDDYVSDVTKMMQEWMDDRL